ncbi:MAG: glycosyltransferase, partial [Catonella sp.]|nr:glycosyltransferase [Catonella sp.]
MKALIVATVYGFVESFLKSDIKLLQDKGYKVYVAVNTEIMNHGGLDGLDIELVDIPFARSPFSSENKRAFDLLYNLMENEAFDLVHCHTPVGGVEARKAVDKLAANGKKRPKVIYTAHGFHFYKGAPVGNWLTFYNVEKKYAKSTDVIVTINHEDYILASEKFKPRLNVRYCPGVGIDTEEIAKLSGNADRAAIRKGLGVPDSAYLIMSIGEL